MSTELIGRKFFINPALQGKKILLYGAAATGQAFYRSAIEQNLEIVVVADQRAKEVAQADFECPVKEPKEAMEYTFDAVVVASSSSLSRSKIRKYLTDQGLSAKSIYDVGKSYFSDGTCNYYFDKQSSSDIINNILSLHHKFIGNMQAVFDLELCFHDFANDMNSAQKKALSSACRVFMQKNGIDSLDIILICMVLTATGQFTSDDMQCMMQAIKRLPENYIKYKYWFNYQMAKLEMTYSKIDYGTFGQDRKEVWSSILNYSKSSVRKYTRKQGKILIMVPYLEAPTASAGTVYRALANACSEFADVKVIVISYCPVKDMLFVGDGPDASKKIYQYQEFNRNSINQEVDIEYIVEEDLEDLIKNVEMAVLHFQPECIIDGLDELAPFSGLFYEQFPVIEFPMRSCSRGLFPSVRIEKPSDNPSITPKANEFLLLPSIPRKPSIAYTRQGRLDIATPEAFVIITVGYRLKLELSQQLLKAMDLCMNFCDKIYWIIVGSPGVASVFEGAGFQNRDKIRFIDYEDDLPALYRICDVYLNPDRQGGGHSIMYAMEQGCAIAGLKKTANIGGGIVRMPYTELVDGDESDLVQYIHQLYRSPALLERKKELCRKKWEADNSDNGIIQLQNLINHLSEEYDLRLKNLAK